jgi:putative phosphoesterase
MTIGIVSDTHQNVARPQQALEHFRSRGIRRVLHCGDVTGPKVMTLFADFQTYVVYGNADRKIDELRESVERLFGADHLAEWHGFEWEGVRLAMVHGHTGRLSELMEGGEYDVVLHGHTHKRRDETVGRTRVINPGALGGIKWQSRSYAILTLPEGRLERYEL